MCPATFESCSTSNIHFFNSTLSEIHSLPLKSRAWSSKEISGLGLPSIAWAYSSHHAVSLLVVLTTASNSHELILTTGIALNFVEEIAIGSPRNFIAITCTVSPSEVTNRLGFRTQWIGWFSFSLTLPLPPSAKSIVRSRQPQDSPEVVEVDFE
jgi:hypothetical protein